MNGGGGRGGVLVAGDGLGWQNVNTISQYYS